MTLRNINSETSLVRNRVAATRASSALVITLLSLALMTIIVVTFLSTMSWEVQASRSNYENQKARGLATLALHTAVTQLRTALGPWDAPYGDEQGNIAYGAAAIPGFLTNPPSTYWSVSPGILSVWNYNSVSPATNIPLFSYPATQNGVANLNAQAEDGTYPILGTSTALPVYWVDVLANPANATPSATNTIIGRYAFWTDDENSKVNINTADGVMNTNFPSTFMGAGTPTEVSLFGLTDATGTTTLTTTEASNIVAYARLSGFNSTRDILGPKFGASFSFYTNNIFNLTTYSRSPDFNIFGQPKMALIPVNMVNYPFQSSSGTIPAFAWNLATFQPLKELFPSMSGYPDAGSASGLLVNGILPWIWLSDNPPYGAFAGNSFAINNSGVFTPTTYKNLRWPLAFEAEALGFNTYNNNGPGFAGFGTSGGFCSWVNGDVIANYLAGYNVPTTSGAGKPITWPQFPGAQSATSYYGKYTARQIDSIAMQIMDLVCKDTSPDAGGSGYAGADSAGHITRGWLSGELVSGVGRSPKLDKILMQYTAAYNTQKGQFSAAKTNVPSLNAQLYLETYFPSRFSGVSLFHENVVNGGYGVGSFTQGATVNSQEISPYLWLGMTNTPNRTGYRFSEQQAGLLPKLPANVDTLYPAGNGGSVFTGTATLNAGSLSYWGNNLLQTDQGVDWNGGNPSVPDSDQTLAAQYHPYLLQTNNTPQVAGFCANPQYTNAVATNFVMGGSYLGAGVAAGQNYPIFVMNSFVKTGHNATLTDVMDDFAPGQYRVVENYSTGANGYSLMSTSAVTAGVVHITGGIAIRFTVDSGHGSDPDPVPLDCVRGSVWPGSPNISVIQPGANLQPPLTPVSVTTAAPSTFTESQAPGYGGQYSLTGEMYINSTLVPYANVINAVIPMTATVNVPTVFPSGGSTVYVSAAVNQGDILVNKFPADWTISSAQLSTMNLPTGTTATDGSLASIQTESATTLLPITGAGGDPDAYWLPTIDNIAGLDYKFLQANGSSVGIDKPQMPRTARFPSIGYLNYIRTGMMPDSEAGNYSTWHGTPFRLFSFAPSTSASAQKVNGVSYPDWAMLDLFFMPSSLVSYGSPYELFAGTNSTSLVPNTYVPVTVPPTTNQYNTPMITYTNTAAVNNMFLFGTCGGATSGRINPNGSVVYTTNANVPTPGISRVAPLEALLHNLVVNQTQQSPYVTTYGNVDSLGSNDFHFPALSAGTPVDPVAVSTAITNYLTGTGNTYGPGGNPAPLRMPAEICNIPAIANYVSPVNAYRNDLVRQIVGNLTTQSNTFSIWVEAQSITKSSINLVNDAATPANYGLYESTATGASANDQITGTVRYHFIVERDLDSGIDGVYGNVASPGPDLIVGTLDDAANTTLNPPHPDYYYKIIYAEEIR